MHLVSLAFEPTEEAAHAVPAIVFVIFFGVFARAFFAFDNEILVGLGQFFEGNVDVDFFAGARPEQVLLRFAKLCAAKNAHHALFDGQPAIGNRLVEVDRNRPTKAAAFRTCPEWIVKAEKPRRRRTNIQITPGTMPVDREGKNRSGGRGGRSLRSRRRHVCLYSCNDIYFPFPKTQRRFDGFDESRAVFLGDRDAILNDLDTGAESFDFWIGIHAHDLVVDPDAQVTLLLEKIQKLPRLSFWRNRNPERDQNNVLAREVGAIDPNRPRAVR